MARRCSISWVFADGNTLGKCSHRHLFRGAPLTQPHLQGPQPWPSRGGNLSQLCRGLGRKAIPPQRALGEDKAAGTLTTVLGHTHPFSLLHGTQTARQQIISVTTYSSWWEGASVPAVATPVL